MRTRSSTRTDRRAQTDDNASNVETTEVYSKNGGFVCDVGDCRLVFGTKMGLAIHKGKRHKQRVHDEVHAEGTCSVSKSSNQSHKKRTNWTSTKSHAQATFTSNIEQLEKEFIPKSNSTKQNDPLYDKLKRYHDGLLKSVTNTTTEKLSSEVLAVLMDPGVIDDCKRQFCWTKDDEKRLNELNATSQLLEPRYDWIWGAFTR